MLRLDKIVGRMTDPELADRLHRLDHAGRVERIPLEKEDTARHRLRVTTDRGTECAIALPRSEHLSDGTVLLLEDDRAIVVQMKEPEWLELAPRDVDAALRLGYFAGNMHWPVRFDGRILRIELHGARETYLERLRDLLNDGRVRPTRDA